jgi:hypothetical protein
MTHAVGHAVRASEKGLGEHDSGSHIHACLHCCRECMRTTARDKLSVGMKGCWKAGDLMWLCVSSDGLPRMVGYVVIIYHTLSAAWCITA